MAPELTPLAGPPAEKVVPEPVVSAVEPTFEQFQAKYVSHMGFLAEKRKAEEEKRRRELEILEAQRLKEEEQKKELQKDSSRRSGNASRHGGRSHREKDEEKSVDPSKPLGGGESPEKKEAVATPEEKKEEEKKEEAKTEPVAETLVIQQPIIEAKVEEVKKEEPPLILPAPRTVLVSQEHIIEKVSEEHYLMLKTGGNVLAGELMLLPLVKAGTEPNSLVYREYATAHPRLVPQRSQILPAENEPENPILEVDQVPSNIRSYFVSTTTPLTESDWDAWFKTVAKLDAIGYMAVPPVGVKWNRTTDACVMHVLPLPCEGVHAAGNTVPVDCVITSAAEYVKKIADSKSDVPIFTIGIGLLILNP